MRYQPSGVERLGPLAAVVALHQERAAEPQLADLADAAVGAGLRVDDPGLEARRGRPNEPRRCSGWSPSSSATRQTLPASVMPSIVWRSSGSAGRTSAGMIGHRLPRRIDEQVAAGEASGRRAGGRPTAAKPLTIVGRSRSSRSSTPAASVALEHTRRRAGDQRAEQRVGEAADPEERRVGEQHLVGRVAAELVEVVEVADQRAVGVDHALRRAGRARGVHDDHAVGRGHRLLGRAEHVVVDVGRPARAAPSDRSSPAIESAARCAVANAMRRSDGHGGAMQRRRRGQVERRDGLPTASST